MSERANFVFRYQSSPLSKYDILFQYINEQKETSKKDFLLPCLSSFWMPLAYASCSDISEEQIKQEARYCIYKLKLHIQFLEDRFGINNNNSYLVPSEGIKNTNSICLDKTPEDNEQDLSLDDEISKDKWRDLSQFQDFQDVSSIFNVDLTKFNQS